MLNYTHIIAGLKGHWVGGDCLPPGTFYNPSEAELAAFPGKFEDIPVEVEDIGEVSPEPQDTSKMTIATVQGLVESGVLDPVEALTEELAGQKRVTLVTWLEERIDG